MDVQKFSITLNGKKIFGMNIKLVQGLLLYLGKNLHEENDHIVCQNTEIRQKLYYAIILNLGDF